MRRSSRQCAAAMLLLTGLLGPRVAAEPPGANPPAPPEYQTVVRGERVDERPPADDPSGFTTVLRIVDPSPGLTLADLLERAPGLRVRQTGPGERQSLSLRGADAQQLAIFLDGVRLTPAGGGLVDLSLLDPAHLELAELRRGGGSARFGAGAIGGVLLLRTPRLGTRRRTRAGFAFGSYQTFAASAAHGGSRGAFRYLASGTYRQGQGDFPYLDDNGVPRRRDNNDSRGGELLLKADRLIAGGRWQVSLLDDLGTVARGAPGMSQRPSASARQQDLRNLATLRARRFDALLEGGRFEVGVAQRYQWFTFEEPAPPPVVSRSQSIGLESSATLGLPLGSTGRLDAGLELRGEHFRDGSLAENPWRLETDLWAASSARLLDRHLVLVPAVRLATATGFGATMVPRLGLLLRPLRWTRRPQLAALELAANIGRSFRYPSFQEMYIRLDGFGGNQTLQPEDAVDLDLGLRWRRRSLGVELVWFQRRLKNLILFAPVSSFLVRADNYRGALAEGIEAAARVGLPLGLELRGSYTLTRARFGRPPMRLPGHPEHRAKMRVEWEPPLTRWFARGSAERLPASSAARRIELRLFSALLLESATVLGRFESPIEEARLLLSAGASLAYRGLMLSAEGENLLDKRDAVDAVGFPLPPARFLVSLAASL